MITENSYLEKSCRKKRKNGKTVSRILSTDKSGGNHSSRSTVASTLKRDRVRSQPRNRLPHNSCFGQGLSCLELLQVQSTPNVDVSACLCSYLHSGMFSVTLSVTLRSPAFRWYPFLVKSGLSSPTFRQQRLPIFPLKLDFSRRTTTSSCSALLCLFYNMLLPEMNS